MGAGRIGGGWREKPHVVQDGARVGRSLADDDRDADGEDGDHAGGELALARIGGLLGGQAGVLRRDGGHGQVGSIFPGRQVRRPQHPQAQRLTFARLQGDTPGRVEDHRFGRVQIGRRCGFRRAGLERIDRCDLPVWCHYPVDEGYVVGDRGAPAVEHEHGGRTRLGSHNDPLGRYIEIRADLPKGRKAQRQPGADAQQGDDGSPRMHGIFLSVSCAAEPEAIRGPRLPDGSAANSAHPGSAPSKSRAKRAPNP